MPGEQTQTILGIIIVVGLILGLVTPVIAIMTGKYGVEARITGYEWLKSLVSMFNRSRTLVEEKEFNITDHLSLKIRVDGGQLDLYTSDRQENVTVRVYKVKYGIGFIQVGKAGYSIKQKNSTLSIDVGGYYIEVVVPSSIHWTLDIVCSGGAIDVDVDTPYLEKVSIDVSGGMADIKLDNMKANITINIDGGMGDVNIEYSFFTGLKTLEVSVSGGVVDVKISVPRETKIRADGSITGGLGTISIYGSEKEFPYIEEDYSKAKSRINMIIHVSGGIGDIDVLKTG